MAAAEGRGLRRRVLRQPAAHRALAHLYRADGRRGTAAGAARLLVVYGPFFVDGETPSPGNLAFDADLRSRDPAWGLRRLAKVADEARRAGLALVQRFDMPANNLMLVFRLRQNRGEQIG